MSFVDGSTIAKLGTMTREEADKLPYGVVKVDNEGRILIYNYYESNLAGVAPSAAEGRNFFTEIAPCTNNRLFFGKFQSGVSSGELDSAFGYTFTYKMKPTNVNIHLLHDKSTKSNWVFVQKKAA